MFSHFLSGESMVGGGVGRGLVGRGSMTDQLKTRGEKCKVGTL